MAIVLVAVGAVAGQALHPTLQPPDPHRFQSARWLALSSEMAGPAPRPTGEPLAYHLMHQEVSLLAEADGPGEPLPEGLVIAPGRYTFAERSWDVPREGLVRFAWPGVGNEQRIVHAGSAEAAMSAMAWIHTHGNRDDGQDLSAAARHGKVVATCAFVSAWAIGLLFEMGHAARVVTTLTLDPWNGYDNGHTLVEVFDERRLRWMAVDLDANVQFVDEHGQPLSLLRLTERLAAGSFGLRALAGDVAFDPHAFRDPATGYDYAFVSALHLTSTESLRQWYQRVLQVPLIQSPDRAFYYPDGPGRDRVDLYSATYHPLDAEAFERLFYPGGTA